VGFVPGCPIDDVGGYGPLTPIAVVLHRTYGQWPGDYSVIKRGKLCQILIGKEPGQWVQFASTDQVHYHCNGANFRAFGVELTGVNEDPLTDWQVQRLHDVLVYASSAHGIPLDYLDPASVPLASVWVNGGGFRGVLSHVSVRTDDGSSQHTDAISSADYARAFGTTTGGIDLTPEESALLASIADTGQKLSNAVFDPKIGLQHKVVNDLPAQIEAVQKDLDAKIAAIPGGGGGGLTEAQVHAIVREELNATKLGA
jgi:hypothetical protein